MMAIVTDESSEAPPVAGPGWWAPRSRSRTPSRPGRGCHRSALSQPHFRSGGVL